MISLVPNYPMIRLLVNYSRSKQYEQSCEGHNLNDTINHPSNSIIHKFIRNPRISLNLAGGSTHT